MNFEKDYIEKVLSGEIEPCSGYRISDDKTSLVKKTEEEIFNNDTTTINGNCEVRNYCKNKIYEYKNYLTLTDYVIVKLNEAMVEDDDTLSELKTKYADELANRKVYRTKINEYQLKLDNLEDLKTLINNGSDKE